jgi:hypothetical protein
MRSGLTVLLTIVVITILQHDYAKAFVIKITTTTTPTKMITSRTTAVSYLHERSSQTESLSLLALSNQNGNEYLFNRMSSTGHLENQQQQQHQPTTTPLKTQENQKSIQQTSTTPVITRRNALQQWTLAIAAATTTSTITFLSSTQSVLAFENKISNQYDDRPRQRGSQVCVYFPIFFMHL